MGSGLLYIVMHGDPDKAGLKRVMEPILRKLGPASFDCVDGKLAWSAKRPVWFQAIVDLLEPYFVPILGIHNSIRIYVPISMLKFLSDELLEDITGGRCGVGDSVRKISQQWLEVCITNMTMQHDKHIHIIHVSSRNLILLPYLGSNPVPVLLSPIPIDWFLVH